MPLPRAVPAVTLTNAERKTLTTRAHGAKTAHRDRLRAQIVLAAARGRDNARIAADLRITVDTARKWRGRLITPIVRLTCSPRRWRVSHSSPIRACPRPFSASLWARSGCHPAGACSRAR
jgi:hypothetical protein